MTNRIKITIGLFLLILLLFHPSIEGRYSNEYCSPNVTEIRIRTIPGVGIINTIQSDVPCEYFYDNALGVKELKLSIKTEVKKILNEVYAAKMVSDSLPSDFCASLFIFNQNSVDTICVDNYFKCCYYKNGFCYKLSSNRLYVIIDSIKRE